MDGDTAVAPYLVAMLLCDQIITEAGTNKKSLIGLFDTVFWPGQPVIITGALYAKLTDAEGQYRFRIDFVHATKETVIGTASVDHPVQLMDRLGFHELALTMPIPIPEVGSYEFRLYANDAYIGRAVLLAKPRERAGE